MQNKIKKILSNKIIKVIIYIVMIIFLTYIMRFMFNSGIVLGTFIRKLIILTSC